MNGFVDTLSDKIHKDIQTEIVKESFQSVIDAVIKVMKEKNFEKDKECTLKRLNKTIEIMNNKFKEQNEGLIDEDVVNNIKFKVFDSKSDLGKVFCMGKVVKKKDDSEDESSREIENDSKVEFIKEIPNALEIPRNLFDIKCELENNINDYHFFTVNISEENGSISYYLTYAELNKFSKRDLLAIFKGNQQLDVSELPQSIRTKYNFK